MLETAFDAPIAHPDRLFIGGEWAHPSSSAKLTVIDSDREEAFLSVAAAQAPDIERAVRSAREAFDSGPWPRLSHAERADWLRKIGQGISERADDIARVWAMESGLLYRHALAVANSLDKIYGYYAGLADSFRFIEEHTPREGAIGLLVREPVGVIAAIVPWNHTPMLTAYKVAPALLAGCTVIIKGSLEAPGTHDILAEICEKIGLPRGIVNVLTADRAVSELLVRNPGIDKVTFTGSTVAGRRIGAICGERVARCTLELGGKSAAVILDDYDVAVAARTIASRAVFLTGQVCSALTRIIVPQSRHDDLVDALGVCFAEIKVGSPFDESAGMGPLAMERQRDRVEGYIAKGIAEGARLTTGGRRPAHLNRGFYIEPTIFANVSNEHTIAREEIFGPVLSVIPAASESEAMAIANDTIFGLNASVFTNDADHAYAAARELRSGTVGHNSFRSDFTIGFGGFKQSGIGREGGADGLLAFLESKTVILDEMPKALSAGS